MDERWTNDPANRQSFRHAFVRFQLRDLDAQAAYLEDFGMTAVQKSDAAIHYRGTGSDAYIYAGEKGEVDAFIAAGYRVDTMAELEALVKAKVSKLKTATR